MYGIVGRFDRSLGLVWRRDERKGVASFFGRLNFPGSSCRYGFSTSWFTGFRLANGMVDEIKQSSIVLVGGLGDF